MSGCPDLTVDQIVTDPIVRALMSADRVDPAAFEALLRSLASKSLASRQRESAPRPDGCSRPVASAL